MPKIPGQQAYYSRQLYQYHFCIVRNQEDGSMPKDGVHCYTWSQDQSVKGSNEVASALHNTLRILSYKGIQEVRLVADGCAGQNKNSTMIGMLLCLTPADEAQKFEQSHIIGSLCQILFQCCEKGRICQVPRRGEKTLWPVR
ncbi:hypothetical protein HPB52_017174 [Rhipicephalus sanguineus]|uniref:Uncharacterized protein n=1 Tax=Rhipicephalus sanguineus TaxID=34632 RepID=A0A9D4QDM6_RHISA|nr:hypothetical protein HPB52_017174 [Rhipicephalus sanguineus]